MKLNGSVFDWLSIDSQRNMAMPNGADWDQGTDLNMKEARRLTTGVKNGSAEHKYDYCADQFDTPAYGWSSTKQHVGIYFINPRVEFLSGGPNHFELTGHLDDGDGGDPTLLDYWRGTHYGGSDSSYRSWRGLEQGGRPDFDLCEPADATPAANFADAKRQAKLEADKWPYAWVEGVDYPKASQRATVSGQLILRDPQAPAATLPNLAGRPCLSRSDACGNAARPAGRTRVQSASLGRTTPSTTSSGRAAPPTVSSPSPTCAPAPMSCMPSPTVYWASIPKPVSPSKLAARSIWAS